LLLLLVLKFVNILPYALLTSAIFDLFRVLLFYIFYVYWMFLLWLFSSFCARVKLVGCYYAGIKEGDGFGACWEAVGLLMVVILNGVIINL
jgi:hypothetical protein